MENENGLPPEIALARSFDKWYEGTRNLITSYRQHGVAVPKLLEAVVKPTEGKTARSLMVLPPPRPEAPPEAKDDWRWISDSEASPQTLILAFLKEGKALGGKELIARAKEIREDINPGVLYNAAARLEDKKIRKVGKNWELIQGEAAPVLHRGCLWAPPELLSVHELAAFRRMSVRHLMAGYPDGIKTVDLFKILKGVDWLKTPISKDLIQDDLESGEGNWCKQMGRSKKWKLISEDDKK